MDEVQQIIERLRDRKLKLVAEKTGISYQGIRNLIKGKTQNPTVKTIDKLREYLDANK